MEQYLVVQTKGGKEKPEEGERRERGGRGEGGREGGSEGGREEEVGRRRGVEEKKYQYMVTASPSIH